MSWNREIKSLRQLIYLKYMLNFMLRFVRVKGKFELKLRIYEYQSHCWECLLGKVVVLILTELCGTVRRQ
jgi:hypothetical protein